MVEMVETVASVVFRSHLWIGARFDEPSASLSAQYRRSRAQGQALRKDSPVVIRSTCKSRQHISEADNQKQLNLKLGPNTVQFSVTSSYSGLAGCSARIFMWDSTDQIVISDIDGTITKCALGFCGMALADPQVRCFRPRLRCDWPRLDPSRHSKAIYRHHQQRLSHAILDLTSNWASRFHARLPKEYRPRRIPTTRGSSDHVSGQADG